MSSLVRSTSTLNSINSTSFSIDAPANIEENDLIVLAFSMPNGSGTAGQASVTPPPEFTLLHVINTSSSTQGEMCVWTKTAGSNEPASYDCTKTALNPTSSRVAGIGLALIGATLVDSAASAYDTTGAGAETSTVNRPTNGALISIAGFSSAFASFSGQTATPPTGFTNQDSIVTPQAAIFAASTDQTPGSSTFAWTFSESVGYPGAVTIAIDRAVDIPETDEEIWSANFADAQGAPPQTTALLRASDAQKLADHNVGLFLNGPQWYRFDVEVPIGEFDQFKPLTVRTFRANLPGLANGKKLLIMSREGRTGSTRITLTCWG